MTVLGSEVKKIDENKLISTASNRLFEDYVKGREIDSQAVKNGINSIKRTPALSKPKIDKTKKANELEI